MATTKTEKTIHERLVYIQQNLKAPKGQTNAFGHYKYRSCEDILEAIKPLLDGLSLVLQDEIVDVNERYYVRATACLSDGKEKICATAFAREAESKKGMDDSQVTGSTSSYARKYALNGLFAIDDTKDADTMDNSEKASVKTSEKPAWERDWKEENVNQDATDEECQHPTFWINEVKKEGPNKGKMFKSCKNCKKFLGFMPTEKNDAHEDAMFEETIQ